MFSLRILVLDASTCGALFISHFFAHLRVGLHSYLMVLSFVWSCVCVWTCFVNVCVHPSDVQLSWWGKGVGFVECFCSSVLAIAEPTLFCNAE